MSSVCYQVPSGSNDWKTLRACSDGDSGPTRDISYGGIMSQTESQIQGDKLGEKARYSRRENGERVKERVPCMAETKQGRESMAKRTDGKRK